MIDVIIGGLATAGFIVAAIFFVHRRKMREMDRAYEEYYRSRYPEIKEAMRRAVWSDEEIEAFKSNNNH